VKHEGQMMPPPPQPALEGVAPENDSGLPQAESLAADDVARARAEREAQVAMQKPVPGAAPVQSPAPALAAPPGEAKKPEPKPAPQPLEQSAPARSDDRRNKRNKKRAEKPMERIESAEEAEHNKPTEAEKEQGTLTGKLILPTGEKPKAEPGPAKAEKPKKLAPGEVFVDDNGNVMIGE
jgi:hypothetical protein